MSEGNRVIVNISNGDRFEFAEPVVCFCPSGHGKRAAVFIFPQCSDREYEELNQAFQKALSEVQEKAFKESMERLGFGFKTRRECKS